MSANVWQWFSSSDRLDHLASFFVQIFKVLLIDSDLRKPQLHNRLGMNNLNGLTDLFVDINLSWEKLDKAPAIKKSISAKIVAV